MTNNQIIEQLLKDFEILKKENIQLRLRIAELEEKLPKYEHPKNSSDTSVPSGQKHYKNYFFIVLLPCIIQ